MAFVRQLSTDSTFNILHYGHQSLRSFSRGLPIKIVVFFCLLLWRTCYSYTVNISTLLFSVLRKPAKNEKRFPACHDNGKHGQYA